MIRQKDSIEHQIIRRQLAVKDEDSKSFTMTIRKILQKYDLPSAYDLLENTPGKDQWKAMVKKATNDSYRKEIGEEIKNKTSLKHLALQENPLDEPHPIYKHTGSDPYEIEKAAIKVRLLTGTYTLQANKHKYNQHEVDKTCELCRAGTEDREHFILSCTALHEARQKHLPKLLELIPELAESNDSLLQCILDSSHEDLALLSQNLRQKTKLIEPITRSLLYELHVQRTRILASRTKEQDRRGALGGELPLV